ncbi:hypothetical protein Acid345_4025 [Candidatus Koribacter versatilis Ellin345]|uniref:Uncharacterized protein n=2 Tax=Candidatus Korobacter versatilis TaxID=658062 RepID=Q1IJC5_KORVE|nr:hypothetical protein Acid345_4025 [Candidatus Koribacter versatilis Ellin345]
MAFGAVRTAGTEMIGPVACIWSVGDLALHCRPPPKRTKTMGHSLAAQVARLEQCRHQYGPESAAYVEKILDAFTNAHFREPETLIRFHDALLFLRAFPQSATVVKRTESLLASISQQVLRLRESGAEMDVFEPEAVSGIAGTSIEESFTYEVARWLWQHYPAQLHADWDEEEQRSRLGATLPRFVPLLEDDALVEADTPILSWLSAAAGGEAHDFDWLMRQFESLPLTFAQKSELYDSLGLFVRWDLEDTPATRTFGRFPASEIFCHDAALIRRNEVSLSKEFSAPPLPMKKLAAKEGLRVLDLVRAALTVRGRELYGTTRADANSVYQCDVGRGVTIYLWGLPPDRRLPLRAYHCGLTVKNGLPINYIEGISLFEWMEVGFNTFYAYRDGETAWIYAKALKLLHQLAGVSCFSVYPYQLGKDNEEALQSGAFWFYRKLGFRPGRPDLLALTLEEEKKIIARPGYRVPVRTLSKLAEHHVFYDLDSAAVGRWDTFSTRSIGLAVQQHMAAKFHGDVKQMRAAISADMATTLGATLHDWNPQELAAFENISLVLALVPDISQWSVAEKQLALEAIRAKAAPEESRYLRVLQNHARLRDAFLQLSSEHVKA